MAGIMPGERMDGVLRAWPGSDNKTAAIIGASVIQSAMRSSAVMSGMATAIGGIAMG